MLSAMPRSMECSSSGLWNGRIGSASTPGFFPRLQEKKALLASNFVWHSITLVVLLVELKDWISFYVLTRHPCLRVIIYQ
jgi:hypothetical protein